MTCWESHARAIPIKQADAFLGIRHFPKRSQNFILRGNPTIIKKGDFQ
jgi:hypothetical protein